MPATFRVENGFYLESRRAYVMRGQVLSGAARAGMYLHVPLNGGVTVTAPIDAVEAVDEPGGVAIGLVLGCQDDLERAIWQDLTSPGEELLLTDRDPAAFGAMDVNE